jgi:hypothetical protein
MYRDLEQGRRLGASTGANVPRPSEKNCQVHQSNPEAPITIKGTPKYLDEWLSAKTRTSLDEIIP